MATVVSIPSVLSTILRNVEYVFSMPSVGVAPEEKYLRYRLKDATSGVYLTNWEYYKPVTDGQNIKIDFTKDLYEIATTPPPPFATPSAMQINTTIIRKIVVEYGEKTINTVTCADPVETTDGTTNEVDVINGIVRPYEGVMSSVGQVLSNRPAIYSLNRGTADWLYVSGTMTVFVGYYGPSFLISTVSYNAVQTHPGSGVTIIPIGFQNAPTNCQTIRVQSPSAVSPSNPSGLMYTITNDLCGCEDGGGSRDLWFQNIKGGIDAVSFDCIESKANAIAKTYFTKRYDAQDTAIRTTGQKRKTSNTSAPTLTLKKQFDILTYEDSKWLDEIVSSGNVWMREMLDDAAQTEVFVRMNIVDGNYPTFGEDVEVLLQVQYSEEFIYPY